MFIELLSYRVVQIPAQNSVTLKKYPKDNTKFTILDNEKRDAHLLYFTLYLLHSSTYSFAEQFSLNLCTGRPLTELTIPDAASVKFNLLMMSI